MSHSAILFRTPCIGVCSTGVLVTLFVAAASVLPTKLSTGTDILTSPKAGDRCPRLDRVLGAMRGGNKLRIIDLPLLEWQLARTARSVIQAASRPVLSLCSPAQGGCESNWLSPEQYGFEILPPHRGKTLSVIRNEVDEEFWLLSAAHYDRYMATSDLFVDGSRSELIG